MKSQKKKERIMAKMDIPRASLLLIAVLLTQSCTSQPPGPIIPFEVVNKTQSNIKVFYARSSSFTRNEGYFWLGISSVVPPGASSRTGAFEFKFDDALHGNIEIIVSCGNGKKAHLDGSRLKRKAVDFGSEMGATYYIENCNEHRNDKEP